MGFGVTGVTKHTLLTDKESAGVIDHADASVTEDKLANASVTENKLGDGAVTENKLGDEAITTDKVKDANITDAKLASSVGVDDGEICKLPTATSGQVLKRGSSEWEAAEEYAPVISTPTRVLDTEYQNTTGRPILVVATLNYERASGIGFEASVVANIGTASPPATPVVYDGLPSKDNEPCEIYSVIVFAVPNNYYYEIVSTVSGAGSNVNLGAWREIEL